jgi:hypothetical protein
VGSRVVITRPYIYRVCAKDMAGSGLGSWVFEMLDSGDDMKILEKEYSIAREYFKPCEPRFYGVQPGRFR